MRTHELLARRLPVAPADVLDVGGGPGAHATWLHDRGHRVVLLDVVPSHVAQARAAGLDAVVADARRLPAGDASHDVVLLLGPLYHLGPGDRAVALAEARRVLRPGGVLAAAAISRWAGLVDLAIHGPWHPDTLDRCRTVLATGRNDPDVGFTTAWFHTPDQLRDEVLAAGLDEVAVVSVEGPLGHTVDLATDAATAVARAAAVAGAVEAEPALLGAGQHLLALARRP